MQVGIVSCRVAVMTVCVYFVSLLLGLGYIEPGSFDWFFA